MMTEPWMDKKKLEEWLQSPVSECIRKDADLKGDNYLSEMHRLLVKTNKGEKALIVKCCLEEGPAAVALKETSIFAKEEQMYGNTLPMMVELLKSAISGDVEPLAPRCLYSCEDFLVMEDLSAQGYKMLNRREGLNLEQCLSVMRTLARFHAASVALHEDNPESMKEYVLHFFDERSTEEGWKKYFVAMTEMLIEELKAWSSEEWMPYIEKLNLLKYDFLDRLRKVTQLEESGYNVLIHGDIWTNNMLFRGNDVRLIDFQLVQFTSPVIDLHLFLTTSPNSEVRAHHIDTLIQEYHTTLNSTLTALSCSRKLLTLDELYEEYRRKALYGVFGVVSECAVMLADPDCGFDLNEAMKGNTPGRKMYSDFFRQVVKKSFPYLDSMSGFDYK